MNLKLEYSAEKDEWVSEYSEIIRVYLEWQDAGSLMARDTFYAYWELLESKRQIELGNQLYVIHKKHAFKKRFPDGTTI